VRQRMKVRGTRAFSQVGTGLSRPESALQIWRAPRAKTAKPLLLDARCAGVTLKSRRARPWMETDVDAGFSSGDAALDWSGRTRSARPQAAQASVSVERWRADGPRSPNP